MEYAVYVVESVHRHFFPHATSSTAGSADFAPNLFADAVVLRLSEAGPAIHALLLGMFFLVAVASLVTVWVLRPRWILALFTVEVEVDEDGKEVKEEATRDQEQQTTPTISSLSSSKTRRRTRASSPSARVAAAIRLLGGRGQDVGVDGTKLDRVLWGATNRKWSVVEKDQADDDVSGESWLKQPRPTRQERLAQAAPDNDDSLVASLGSSGESDVSSEGECVADVPVAYPCKAVSRGRRTSSSPAYDEGDCDEDDEVAVIQRTVVSEELSPGRASREISALHEKQHLLLAKIAEMEASQLALTEQLHRVYDAVASLPELLAAYRKDVEGNANVRDVMAATTKSPGLNESLYERVYEFDRYGRLVSATGDDDLQSSKLSASGTWWYSDREEHSPAKSAVHRSEIDDAKMKDIPTPARDIVFVGVDSSPGDSTASTSSYGDSSGSTSSKGYTDDDDLSSAPSSLPFSPVFLPASETLSGIDDTVDTTRFMVSGVFEDSNEDEDATLDSQKSLTSPQVRNASAAIDECLEQTPSYPRGGQRQSVEEEKENGRFPRTVSAGSTAPPRTATVLHGNQVTGGILTAMRLRQCREQVF